MLGNVFYEDHCSSHRDDSGKDTVKRERIPIEYKAQAYKYKPAADVST